MKQKYLILKNNEKNELIIREFLEINKEMFSLVCEETYDNNDIESAIAKDRKELVSILRTNNMFPVWLYADKLAESIISMYGTEYKEPIKLLFDDAISFSRIVEDIADLEEVVDKIPDEDELLEDDFDDHKPLKTNCSIKVADDEPDDDMADSEETN
ncbi:MAG: hypothetical protein ISS67_05390 [Desulfobacterales bacterium]|uniref:Uncharacterized protein n=1 Tax=Candidatus Desulfaltia bathyphila TaxID=2841697 RepID=A0A8J6T5Q9_9BACT|nr:hypothetical protein [Candidatus Desulfaltia bathyphila]MBL7195092.1 hypothetical protein [Desulfobacterales bacterium]MBL7207940.1 hypothetical protein [Desulfobacterales bacterium]